MSVVAVFFPNFIALPLLLALFFAASDALEYESMSELADENSDDAAGVLYELPELMPVPSAPLDDPMPPPRA